MSTPTRNRPRRVAPAGLIGYQPLNALWASPQARLFPSEQSARWFIRQHRGALTEANALAMHTGKLFVHPERFGQVVEATALQAARLRGGLA